MGIVGHVALTKKSVNIADAYHDPRFDASLDRKSGFLTKSCLTVPVTDRDGGTIAVVQALNKTNGSTFTEEDLANLE